MKEVAETHERATAGDARALDVEVRANTPADTKIAEETEAEANITEEVEAKATEECEGEDQG